MNSPQDKFHDLRPDPNTLKSVKDERLVMTLQCIAVGSMLVLAMAKAAHVIRELFRHNERNGRSK
jgi:hypothetical protein